MKIAFIGQKGIPAQQGGIEKHVENLSVKLVKADFDVTVYSRPHYTQNKKTPASNATYNVAGGKKQIRQLADTKTYRGVKIINLPSINTKHLDAISHTFLASVHALFQNYDIIHYHGVGPALLSWLPKIFKPNAKVIATFHCIDRQHQGWGRFAKLMLGLGEWAACRFPDETITVSQTLKKYCQFRFDKETIYIPNGVATSQRKNKSQILTKYNLKKNNYFLTVSRLVPQKRIHMLIEAYQIVETQNPLRQLADGGASLPKLVIVGSGAKTKNYVEHLERLAQGNPNIIFTGQQTGANLEALFKNGYLFIQPSEAEGLSVALLEAISYGAPVLISDIEENQEVVNGLGLEFKNKDINDLAKQLKWALKNPTWLKKQAALAKRQINKKYNWQDISRQTIELYWRVSYPEKKNQGEQLPLTIK